MRLLTEIALVALAAVGVAVCLALLPEVAHKRRRPVQRALLAPPGQLGELRGLVSSAGTHDLHVSGTASGTLCARTARSPRTGERRGSRRRS
jgi:hypothetical protein